MSVHAHRTERISASEAHEEANGVGGRIRVGGENGKWNGVGGGNDDVNVYGTVTEMEGELGCR